MSPRRRVAAFFDRRLARRLILAPLTVLATLLAIGLFPVLLVGTALSDLLRGRRRRPRVRILVLVTGGLLVETVGMMLALIIWLVSGFGLLGSDRWRWHLHRRLLGLYTRTLFALVTRVIGTSVIWRDHADLSTGPVVLLARHTSFFDALIPGIVLSHRNRLLSHHVVTHGLRYSPCIDIVGHRFPNRFIRRSPGEGSSELGPISRVGAALDRRSGAIIFPEGTFRSPERFERVLRRLRRREPEKARRAADLHHVLPPRPNGTYALLQGAPAADVVICVNTGLESFGSIRSILDSPYSDRPIIIETWRIPRSEIPDDADGFNDWLFDQYVMIDEWVVANLHEPD